MRDKLLQAQGWKVISIPWYDWNANTSLMAKQQYIHKHLPDILLRH